MANAKTQKTTASLRDLLFEEIDQMRSENSDPVRARTVATLSREILSTARLDLQFQELTAKLQSQGASVNFAPLALGSK